MIVKKQIAEEKLGKDLKGRARDYYVLSESGKKNLGGPYPSIKAAKNRLRQVEYFKRNPEQMEFYLEPGTYSMDEVMDMIDEIRDADELVDLADWYRWNRRQVMSFVVARQIDEEVAQQAWNMGLPCDPNDVDACLDRLIEYFPSRSTRWFPIVMVGDGRFDLLGPEDGYLNAIEALNEYPGVTVVSDNAVAKKVRRLRRAA